MGRQMVSFALLIIFLTAVVHFHNLFYNSISTEEDVGFLVGGPLPVSKIQDPNSIHQEVIQQTHHREVTHHTSRLRAHNEHSVSNNHHIEPISRQRTTPHHVNGPGPKGLGRDRNEGIRQEIHRVEGGGPVSSTQENIETVAVLLPAWEVLVVVSPDTHLVPHPGESFHCHYPNKETSDAEFAGILPFTNSSAFKCALTKRNHRRRPFPQPVLKRSTDTEPPISTWPELPRWSFLVYESFSTDSDVVVFVKGVNNKQGFNRSPADFRCVFGDDARSAVKTAVTSSVQEVFRCRHPILTAPHTERVKISLEIPGENNRQIPSVAYYTPPRMIATPSKKSLMCACTMVYNSAKFLREWVTYHSTIGVEKFILYDNGSTDDSEKIISELNDEGFHVEKVLWLWPKTQEAGFSHGAIYANDSCVWMMYLDVDEFVYSPSWLNSSNIKNKLNSLLPSDEDSSIGQISIKCNEFGPSGKEMHPPEGLTQGYTCRRLAEQRHKSIVRLEAVDYSLLNQVHHFVLNKSLHMSLNLGLDVAVVNHYKYQAWPEFRNKFRRRVSAYVPDWTEAVNPGSQDRTPGLGFEPVEPPGWSQKFCEVTDERLKQLTEKWFGSPNLSPNNLAWQK